MTDSPDDTGNPGEQRKAAPVETISSYARRDGDVVRVVMHLPDADWSAGPGAAVRLQSQRGTVRADATVLSALPGLMVKASFPKRKLPPATWRVSVRPDAQTPFQRAQARLLVSNQVPLALLPGAAPRQSIDPPAPQRRLSAKQKVAHQLGRVGDRGLSLLPDDRAAKTRETLRRAARKVLR